MKTVLIADDDQHIRKLLRRHLERRGYRIIEAANGREAVRCCQETRPDLLITDLIMPDQEGIETIVELKQTDPILKTIAISGGGRIEPQNYLNLAKQLGVAFTMEKPLDMPVLLQMVDRLTADADTSTARITRAD